MKKRIMLVLLATLLVFTLVGTSVLAKDPDKGASGVPFQELWEALENLTEEVFDAIEDLQEQIDGFSINWDDIEGIPDGFADDVDNEGTGSEIDPVYRASPASGISNGDITNWDTVYGWGDHSTQGYLTSLSETDPVYSASPASDISNGDITNWDTAYGWGDHSATGYLTGEADPTVLASVKDGIDWSELTNRPAGLDDGDDVGGAGDGHSLDAADGDPIDAVYVDNYGNVGIGTTSPGKKLDVEGKMNADHYFLNDQLFVTQAAGSGTFYYGWDVSVTGHVMATGGETRLVIDSDGDVGIGTQSPSEKLEVDGNARVSGDFIAPSDTDYRFSSAKLYKALVNPWDMEFSGIDSVGDNQHYSSNWGFQIHGKNDPGFASLNVPVGHTIKDVTALVYNYRDGYQVRVGIMRRTSISTTAPTIVASGLSNTSAGYNVVTFTANHIVLDDSLYVLYVESTDPITTADVVVFYGARVNVEGNNFSLAGGK